MLREQLLLQWPVDASAIDAWLSTLRPAQLSTSDNDNRTLGAMNRFVDEFTFQLDWFRTPLLEPHHRVADWSLNKNVVGGGKVRHALKHPNRRWRASSASPMTVKLLIDAIENRNRLWGIGI